MLYNILITILAIKKSPIRHGQAIFLAFILVIQYALPILIISVLHSRTCKRLQLCQITWNPYEQMMKLKYIE